MVISVEPVGVAEVYNLQTNDPAASEYFAGGILVHNCLRYGLLVPGALHEEPIPKLDESNGRDPAIKWSKQHGWVGQEVEHAENEYSHGAGGSLPVGYGL